MRRGQQVRWTLLVALTTSSALLLSGCAGGASPSAPVASVSRAATDPPSQTPSESPTSGIPADASPLSGRAAGADKPVLVVKLDNTPAAQPHAGLTYADIVVVEEVEFGLTRLAAVFSSTIPSVVGPIRSARISDIDLLAQFGRPAFAYSGAQHKLRPRLASASIYDVSGDKGPGGYFRERGRRAPYDFMGKPAALLKRAPRASGAQDVGYVFSVATPSGGKGVKVVTASYPDSSAQFVWNAKAQGFDVRLNDKPARAAEGGTQLASTVVIQYVKQYDSGFGDKYGGRTPKEDTVGTGKAIVLRDGKAWPVTWSRPVATGGTTYTAADGSVVAFRPGQVWVALVNAKTPAVLG